jgi:thiol:disulfide interchange protein
MQSAGNPYKPLWVLFAAIVIVMAGIALSKNFLEGKDRIPWRRDLDAATIEAKRDNKPRLLYFTASWCGPCQRLKTETWNDKNVESKLAGYVPVKIDIDEHADTAQNFQIDGIPTFIVLDGSDAPLKRSTGFMPASDFLEWLGGS